MGWELVASSGQTYLLHDGAVAGRSTQSDIVVEDSKVSRRHAQFRMQDDQIIVHDLGSVNGTLVDGIRITSPALLKDGVKLRIGDTTFRLRRSNRQIAATALDPKTPALPASARHDVRYCSSCGMQLSIKGRFCPNCGESLAEPHAQAALVVDRPKPEYDEITFPEIFYPGKTIQDLAKESHQNIYVPVGDSLTLALNDLWVTIERDVRDALAARFDEGWEPDPTAWGPSCIEYRLGSVGMSGWTGAHWLIYVAGGLASGGLGFLILPFVMRYQTVEPLRVKVRLRKIRQAKHSRDG
jgi:hypothetical protein